MNPNELIKRILKDVEVELKDEFDRNFERKAFFDKPWPKNKLINRKGSMMARNNHLRRSISTRTDADSIIFTSSLPYALIHNEGGTITVTAKMKKFFWHKYYETSGKVKTLKNGQKSTSKQSQRYNIEAEQWKNLALMKVGDQLTIPQRQFIGEHPVVTKAVETIIKDNMKELQEYFKNNFKK